MQTRVLRPTTPVSLVAAIGLVLIGAYVATLLVLMERTSFDIWGGVLLVPFLVALTIPALRRQATREGDPLLFRVLLLALLLKLGGAAVRYFVAFSVYGGIADAQDYHEWGVRLSEAFRHGVYDTGLPDLVGTEFIRFLSGIVYTAIGPSKLGGFFLYSWFGFWGLYFFYRAFVLAVPVGSPRSYAHLVLFLPSLVFWPSSIGKEAWMMMALGIAAFGIARLLRGELWRGGTAFAIGLAAALAVRPHVAGLVACAMAVGFIVRRVPTGFRQLAPVVKAGTLIAVAIVALLLVRQTDRFLRDEGIDTEGGVGSTLEDVNERTSEGGSEYSASALSNPARAPIAVVTVLFRPFLFEAHNAKAVVAALEGTLLIGLVVLRWQWMWAAVKRFRDVPYLAFVLAYGGAFILAFSSIANFGLLARERVQLYPFALVLLAVPPIGSRFARSDDAG